MDSLTMYLRMQQAVARFATNDDGATAIEYALIAVGIGMAIIASVFALGTDAVLPMFKSLTSMF